MLDIKSGSKEGPQSKGQQQPRWENYPSNRRGGQYAGRGRVLVLDDAQRNRKGRGKGGNGKQGNQRRGWDGGNRSGETPQRMGKTRGGDGGTIRDEKKGA